MPGASRRVPQVAQVEDCDSDESSVKPGTRVQAKRRALSVKPPQRRDAASDSGYSSHRSAPTVASQTQNVLASSTSARQTAPATSSKNRPIVHDSRGKQTRPEAPSRSASVSRPSNTERRYNLPQQPQPQSQPQKSAQQVYAEQYAAWAAQYPEAAARHRQQQQQQYPAQQAQLAAAQAVPSVTSQPRPQVGSTARSRPVSIHGYPMPSATPTAQHGPPPSPSAYHNYLAAYYQQYQTQPQYQQQPLAYLSSTPPMQTLPAYPATSPLANSPGSPNYVAAPALQRNYSAYSARQPNPDVAGLSLDMSNVIMSAQQPASARPYSARQPSASYMPGAYPNDMAADSDSESDSESASEDSSPDFSEDERDRERARKRDSKRDSRLMPPPPARRPSMPARKTAPVVVPIHSSRHQAQRAPRSDTGVDYPSSSDQFDSDRTARAIVGRARTESTFHSSHSRRPSVSTSASSAKTRATTVSSGSGSRKVIIEDKNGRRRTAYLPQEQLDDIARFYERQRREEQERQERIEAYQQQVRGPQVPELTADNIRKVASKRSSGSHVSQRSHKSSSSKASKSEGIKIQAGDTVLHVYGEASVEMRPGEDGGPAILKIGSGSSRDSAYYGSSKGSGSRVSKRREIMREVDGYEEAL